MDIWLYSHYNYIIYILWLYFIPMTYPVKSCQNSELENINYYSWFTRFTHKEWWLSTVMLVYQRVYTHWLFNIAMERSTHF